MINYCLDRNMPIIECQLVNIEIDTIADGGKSVLRLNYRGQRYDFARAFATDRLDPATAGLPPERIQRQVNRSIGADELTTDCQLFDRGYLLVREIGYYSLWQIDLTASTSAATQQFAPPQVQIDRQDRAKKLGLQQASIWLFQELWLQLEDQLGDRQLQLASEKLIAVVPQIRTWVDLDRLSTLDPLTADELSAWSETDWIVFDRQLYQFAQKKLGQQFAISLTNEIVRSMPEQLNSTLANILNM